MVRRYLRGFAVTVKDFLKQRAVNIVVGGNYELPNWLDAQGRPRNFACRTSRVSPFRMIVAAPVVGRVGDQITSYFGDFGSLEGRISDTTAGEFLLELNMTGAMRQKMADKLSWLEKKLKDASVQDARRQARIIPAVPHSALTLADGSIHSCFIIDVSVSGAAVSADLQPAIGTPLAVGACIGRVVRHLPDGFAVQFVEPQNRADLERRIARPPQLRVPGVRLAREPAQDNAVPDADEAGTG
ncbi:MAG: type pilus assembly PilZ [Tardiphaga sp.]|nr:type pilus assembly PilZ [Tardiphaga sp.]